MREIAELIEKKNYAEAYVLVAELKDFATSKGQLVKAAGIQDWLFEKLCLKHSKTH